MKKDDHFISVIKGVTWRIIGTLDTMMLSYLFTHSISNALKIGFTEVFTKIFLFYVHERIWFKVKWGLSPKKEVASNTIPATDESGIAEPIYEESHLRSVIKGISWRITGTLDTIIIATLWTGNYTKALQIGFTEVITKVTLYYLHERIWMHFTAKNRS